jgi:hypothetical protein
MANAPLATNLPQLKDLDGVASTRLVRGTAHRDAAPSLLLEIAHGATRAAHYDELRARLRGSYPPDLRDFFFVNTDVGAPELAERTAERFVAARPTQAALVVRCLVPRTFVDCNRLIDVDGRPRSSAAGEMTPGLHAYVQDDDDRQLVLERYAAWRALTERAFEQVCGSGGLALQVHSYAPRSIDVPVDERIVERLRAEYEPARLARWPLRPQVDLIALARDGELLASAALLANSTQNLRASGYEVAVASTYHLHEATLAHALARRHAGRTLCLELRRDLLARDFTPFAEMEIDPGKVEPVAEALAGAVAAALDGA